jgi:pimeloyl-ACP methyl ester carboxylesterase
MSMSKKITFKTSQNINLCGILNGPRPTEAAAAIVLCHGFGTSKDSRTYLSLEEPLNAAGISTFRFDFFGHGESEGRFAEITVSEAVRDALAAIEYVRETGYQRIGLVGSSFGGLAAILTAAQVSDLCLLALKSPVSDYMSRLFVDRDGHDLQKWRDQGFIQIPDGEGNTARLNYSFYEDADKISGYTIADKISAPTLIVHGDQDESVPVEQSVKLASLIPDCRLEILKGADHRYSFDPDFAEMLRHIRDFCVELCPLTDC